VSKAAKKCTRTIHIIIPLNTAVAGFDNQLLCAVLFCCVWCWQYHQLSHDLDRADRAVRYLLSPAHPKAVAPQIQAGSGLLQPALLPAHVHAYAKVPQQRITVPLFDFAADPYGTALSAFAWVAI